jgi:predicted ATP-grasp superfamily ATP-dependent carboligase
MRVFVYEYLTALGYGRDPADPMHPMYREGRAMRDAVLADLRQLPGVEAVTTPDGGGGAFTGVDFEAAVEESERQVIIAPETLGVLFGLTLVAEMNGNPLGCHHLAVELTGDKLALAAHWREHGSRTPAATDRQPTACEAFPVVWKPQRGCGSTDTFLLKRPFDVTRAKAQFAARNDSEPMILQEFVTGRAASIAFLCGPAGNVPLVPAFQHLSGDGRFHYLGGELPIPPQLADRAVMLAARAIACVRGLKGYVGVDLVLGDAADGSQDYAIEINPRLTTSYVGLRAMADINLAGGMLRVAEGEPAPELRWKPGRVRFTPDGAATRTV